MIFMGKQFSQEELNLNNPAYVGTLLYQSVREYQDKSQSGMHCGLIYLVAPLSISVRYLEILPKNISPSISSWAKQYEGELSGFPESVFAYADIVNSSIAFLLQREMLVLDDMGYFHLSDNSTLPKRPDYVRNDIRFNRSYLSAGLLGRWFSQAAAVESVYAQLGIRP